MRIQRTLCFIVCVGLIIGCAEGDVETEDGSGGMAGDNRGVGSGAGGMGGSANVNPSQGCRGDGDCAVGLRCNFSTGVCEGNGQGAGGQGGGGAPQGGCTLHSDCPDGTLCNAQGQCEQLQMGGGGAGGAGSQMGGGPQVMNACSDPASQQVLNGTQGCQASCDEMHAMAQEECNRTPSRIADCLASAALEHMACSDTCVDISATLAACGMSCVNAGDPRPCVAACIGRGFQLNADCLGCYGEYFGCSFLECGAICAQGGAIDMCVQCRQNNCAGGFQACAGIQPPY
jgi:hypothetical protein